MNLKAYSKKKNPIGYRSPIRYLKALFEGYKKVATKYSYSEFSQELGLGFGNVSWLLINGKRKLSKKSANKIAEALDFKSYVKEFWDELVEFSQLKTSEEREASLQKLLDITRKATSNQNEAEMLDFYSDWFNPLLFEALEIEEIASNPENIQEYFFPKLTKIQVNKGIDLLEKMKLIEKDRDTGRYIKCNQNFESLGRVPGIGIIRYHQKMADLSKEALECIPVSEREMGSITAAISSESFEKLKEDIRAFQRYLVYFCEKNSSGDRLVQINVQGFSLTKSFDDENKKVK